MAVTVDVTDPPKAGGGMGLANEKIISQAPELRSLDRFPAFLAARRSLLANVLNERRWRRRMIAVTLRFSSDQRAPASSAPLGGRYWQA
ncbi:hypothetical protein AMK10_23835 [Streptomyces sp. CB02058]|nr:hypothetical protein AMK10_23835 [Streptomyces sp. CB02058]